MELSEGPVRPLVVTVSGGYDSYCTHNLGTRRSADCRVTKL